MEALLTQCYSCVKKQNSQIGKGKKVRKAEICQVYILRHEAAVLHLVPLRFLVGLLTTKGFT